MAAKSKQSGITLSYVATIDVAHFSGGLRGTTSNGGKLLLYPTTKGDCIDFPGTKSIEQRKEKLRELGLQLVGVEEISEREPSEVSTWHPWEVGPEERDTKMIWSGISHSAANSGDVELADTVRNIWFSVNASALRVRDVSRAYHVQNTMCIGQEIDAGIRFSNIAGFDLYMSLHSALVEMCSTRDYMAKLVGKTLLGRSGIDNMFDLSKKLKSEKCTHPVAYEIRTICDRDCEGAWMARLGKYRNLVVHEAPISNFADTKGMTARTISVGDSKFHLIVVPFPGDPFIADGKFVDALSYVRFAYAKLADFSTRVADATGLSSDLATLTDADLA